MVFPFSSIKNFTIDLNEEHELTRTMIRDFAEKILSNYVKQGELMRDIPQELKIKAKELGLYGIDVKPEYGGQGGDYLSAIIVAEELSRIWPSFATFFLINWMFNRAINEYGNEEQKKKYITQVATGEKVAAFAVTEPAAGSDVAGIQTTAKKENGYYILNGRKLFITNGDIADYYIIAARTIPPQREARWKGISLFIVEKDWGVKPVSRLETIGLKASHTTELALDNVKVPAENLLGEENMGFKYAVETFDYARTIVAAQALGIAQRAFEIMSNYSLQRTAFDTKLANFQNIQLKIADSLADLEASRLLTYWAGTLYQRNMKNEYIIVASLAKFFVTEAAERIVLRAMIEHGGYGVTTDIELERMLRDLQILKTYEGTNDIQRISAARQFYNRFMGVKV
ncbi:MAG: acyl-CoA dehydrogenase family protein [Sulfolobaceae archaeon]|nr:acyl-CoA dehydrogenase family protein [Sulfolobaceae archaeon]